MKIDTYKMNCTNCDKWMKIEADKVTTHLDLYRDRFIFESNCPQCGLKMVHSRDAFSESYKGDKNKF